MSDISEIRKYCLSVNSYNLGRKACPEPEAEKSGGATDIFGFIRNLVTTPLPSPLGCGDNLLSPADAQVENQDATEPVDAKPGDDAQVCKPNGLPRESLTFSYQNWSADEISKLDIWLQKLIPIMEQYYGKPQFGNQITVDKQAECRSNYNGCDKSVTLCASNFNYYTNLPDIYLLSHEVTHAFHNEFAKVSNEEGFANLLSFYTTYQYWYTYGPEELNNNLYPAYSYSSMLGIYDLNNQKAGRKIPHCYIEDQLGTNLDKAMETSTKYNQPFAALAKLNVTFPNFMQNFNNALYQLPAPPYSSQELLDFLRNQILPTDSSVEGMPIADWFKAQYALGEIDDAGYKFFAPFSNYKYQFWDLIDLSGIYIWEDRYVSEVTPYCTSLLEKFVFSGTANIRVEDFQGSEVFKKNVDIKDGISQNNISGIIIPAITIPLHQVNSSQRMRMIISITTPEGTTEEKEFYLPYCSVDTTYCRPDFSIQGIINGFPYLESLSGNVDVEIDAYRWNTGDLTNIKESTTYNLGYFILDLSKYPSLLEAEKSFVRFSVKSNLGNQLSFSDQRIWLAPDFQTPFFVSLNAN